MYFVGIYFTYILATDHWESRNREIHFQNCIIAFTLDRRLESIAAKAPAKFQNDTTI